MEPRNAVLTGASRGIGPYIARALAARGMNLLLVARSEPELARLARELRSIRMYVPPLNGTAASAHRLSPCLTVPLSRRPVTAVRIAIGSFVTSWPPFDSSKTLTDIPFGTGVGTNTITRVPVSREAVTTKSGRS